MVQTRLLKARCWPKSAFIFLFDPSYLRDKTSNGEGNSCQNNRRHRYKRNQYDGGRNRTLAAHNHPKYCPHNEADGHPDEERRYAIPIAIS